MISQKEVITIITKPAIFDDITNQTMIVIVFMFLGFGLMLYQSGLLLIWYKDEEYGHGLMVVALLIYILFHNRHKLIPTNTTSRWLGVPVSLVALAIYFLGELSGIDQIRMYSVWLFSIAAAFSIGGWLLFKTLLIPILIIFLLIPLPGILGPLLTAKLQLISSEIGVWVVRLFGGVVFLEGNVIDMGEVKLLVAEACAGLRYLFPLMSIGAIAGYLMRAPLWMRWTLFLSTIPVTIIMNSFRIGVTGLLTEAYGTGHTEGFLHFFEGWVVFITSLVILAGLTRLLLILHPAIHSFSELFSVELKNYDISSPSKYRNVVWQKSAPAIIMIVSLFVGILSTSALFEREQEIVNRKPLSQFPAVIGSWKSSESKLPPTIEAVAGASDYYYGDFVSPSNKKVNLYIAYYDDQKKGVAPHSPAVCIPGDGWVIESNKPFTLYSKVGKEINVSRLIITKNNKKIITYYWLKQGSRTFYQQLMARIDLIRFAVEENRADAALIRMVSEVSNDENIVNTDERMQSIASEILGVLSEYIPD